MYKPSHMQSCNVIIIPECIMCNNEIHVHMHVHVHVHACAKVQYTIHADSRIAACN